MNYIFYKEFYRVGFLNLEFNVVITLFEKRNFYTRVLKPIWNILILRHSNNMINIRIMSINFFFNSVNYSEIKLIKLYILLPYLMTITIHR